VTAHPKPVRERDPVYLSWIREQPCIVCDAPGPSDPHHLDSSGTGTRGSDYEVIPVCRACHDRIQGRDWVLLWTRFAFTEMYAWRAQSRLYRQWVRDLFGDYRVGLNGETLVYDGPENGRVQE